MRILLLTISLCMSGATCFADDLIQNTANDYFQIYSSRNDFGKFMQFYAEDAVLKDIVYGVELHGAEEIAGFFDWDRGDFRMVNEGPALVVEDQVVSNNTVVSAGRFEEFHFDDKAEVQ